MQQKINNTLQNFSGISLDEMNGVALMKRTDTKFIIPKLLLSSILEGIKADYKVLEIQDNRIMNYASLYFDTSCKRFYHDHHNGKSNRLKIRIRKYVESDLFFLEIKQKDIKGITHKSRIPVKDFETSLSKTSLDFIKETTSQNHQLTPSLWNEFNRITLVNMINQERITVDFGLSFMKDSIEKKYDDLVIIEVKQKRYNRNTPIVKQLKTLGYHPYSISKYCIGMISLNSDLKYNIFKKKLIKINKITAS